jgi:uncharacterized protein YjiS (DUF1127 family)
MMTQPIQKFQNLSSATPPAGGNDLTKIGIGHDDRRLVETRARYGRAALLADSLTDTVLWAGRLVKRAAQAIKADFRLRAAEDQLFRMSDRELADIGLSRAEISFAIRDLQVEGVSPLFDAAPEGEPAAANRNTNPAIYWAGRA